MKLSLREMLACPSCRGALDLSIAGLEGDEVMEGELTCSCGAAFPVRGGVPRFAPSVTEAASRRTARAFGWEWRAFPEMEPHHERQFLDWIAPVGPERFQGSVVLEGGCGKGRHTTLAGRWGARAVIGIDLSDAVDVAFAHTRHQPHVHVVQGDLRQLPLRPGSCDYAFSVGVLHHLPEPEDGFRSLARAVRPGGALSVWVYGAENNGWIHTLVSPLRKWMTSRLPPAALYPISFVAALPLWAVLRILYWPASRRPEAAWARRLPYGAYLRYISGFPFREIHHIVHDHLAAPVAHYVSRQDVEGWYSRAGAGRVAVAWHNENSWRGYGEL